MSCPKTWIVSPKGITATPTTAVTKTISGAKQKTHLSAAAGIRSSLPSSLMPSAIGCSEPLRTGPRRSHPVLHGGEHLALVIGHVRHADEQDVHDDEGDDEIEPERHIRHACFPLPLPGFPNPALIRDVRSGPASASRRTLSTWLARQAQRHAQWYRDRHCLANRVRISGLPIRARCRSFRSAPRRPPASRPAPCAAARSG